MRVYQLFIAVVLLAALSACGSPPATNAGRTPTSEEAGAAPSPTAQPATTEEAGPPAAPQPATGGIIYTRINLAEQREELWIVAADGSDDRLLLRPDCSTGARCIIPSLALSPDGKIIAYVVEEELFKGKLYLADADGSNSRLVAEEVDSISKQPFSPDGASIAFLRIRDANPAPVAEASIWVVPIGGEPRMVVDWGFFIAAPFWENEQYLVFSQAFDGTPPSNWRTFRLALAADAQPHAIASGQILTLSPDRQSALVLVELQESDFENRDLGLLSLAGGQPVPLTFQGGPSPRAAWSPDGAMIAVADPQTARLDLLRAADQAQENLLVLPPDSWVASLTWSADGRSLVFRQGTTLRAVDVQSGQERGLMPKGLDQPRNLEIIAVP